MRNRKRGTARIATVTAAVIGAAMACLAVAGCGGGGGGSTDAAVDSSTQTQTHSFTITRDTYGVQNSTYLAATRSALGLVLRAAIATDLADPAFKTVCRIDIPQPGEISAGAAYSLGEGSAQPRHFPGTVYFFNGHPSTLLRTTGGTITFTSYGASAGDLVAGHFTADVVDGNDSADYTIAASFSFKTGDDAPIVPAPAPVPPSAFSVYSTQCAGCHTLGSVDTVSGEGPELALKGGRLSTLFPAGGATHQRIALRQEDIAALRVLLNAN